MKISLLPPLATSLPLGAAGKGGNDENGNTAKEFGDVLRQTLGEVNRLQLEADRLTQAFLAGQVEDVHQVVLATEKANLALQLTVQVRNKVVEAYQEIARMQV